MIGLEVNGKPLMRAYSVVSANYEDHLEFYSIKVQDGPLTSKLQHLKEGDTLLVSRKPTGSLIMDNLKAGKNLYLLSTGTGLAPFMSVVRDPEFYEAFDKIILTHGVRWNSELGYFNYLTETLPNNEFFGEQVKDKLIYYPTVTRDEFSTQGRLTDKIRDGKLFEDINLPALNPETDRVMICGSPSRRVNQNGGWNFKPPFFPAHFPSRSYPETNGQRFFVNHHSRPVLGFVKVNVRHVASSAFAAFSQNVY
jgi:ferredoxin--NADP+ reductase